MRSIAQDEQTRGGSSPRAQTPAGSEWPLEAFVDEGKDLGKPEQDLLDVDS